MLHPLYWLHLFYFFHFAVANRRDDNHHGGNLVVAGAPVRYLFFFFLWPADFDYYYYYCFDRMKKCGQTNQMSLPSCVTWFPSLNIIEYLSFKYSSWQSHWRLKEMQPDTLSTCRACRL